MNVDKFNISVGEKVKKRTARSGTHHCMFFVTKKRARAIFTFFWRFGLFFYIPHTSKRAFCEELGHAVVLGRGGKGQNHEPTGNG